MRLCLPLHIAISHAISEHPSDTPWQNHPANDLQLLRENWEPLVARPCYHFTQKLSVALLNFSSWKDQLVIVIFSLKCVDTYQWRFCAYGVVHGIKDQLSLWAEYSAVCCCVEVECGCTMFTKVSFEEIGKNSLKMYPSKNINVSNIP